MSPDFLPSGDPQRPAAPSQPPTGAQATWCGPAFPREQPPDDAAPSDLRGAPSGPAAPEVRHDPPPDRAARRRLVLQSLAWAGLSACERHDPAAALRAVPSAGPLSQVALPLDRDHLVGQGIILPGLIDERGGGPMMRLVEAVWATQLGVSVRLEALPLERVVDNVINGVADFGFPDVRLPGGWNSQRGYRWSTRPMGQVSFVLYSRRGAEVTRQHIEALRRVRPFPLEIEAPDLEFGFPLRRFTSLGSALSKVAAGRLDALLWAQEEADDELRRLQLANVHRALYSGFDDVLMIHEGARRAWVDQTWSQGVAALSASGRMGEMYRQVHRAFDPWQPGRPVVEPAALPNAAAAPHLRVTASF